MNYDYFDIMARLLSCTIQEQPTMSKENARTEKGDALDLARAVVSMMRELQNLSYEILEIQGTELGINYQKISSKTQDIAIRTIEAANEIMKKISEDIERSEENELSSED